MPTQISGSTGVPASALPFLVGQVIFTAGSAVQSGFLKCNGAAVSRITYAALFAVCGTIYGAGDGSTTFNLPDLRGELLRCLDDGREVDSARVLGSSQGDAMRNLTGSIRANSFQSGGSVAASTGVFANDLLANAQHASGGGAANTLATYGLDASRQVPTANEFRPRNVALLACIFTGVNQ